MTLIGLPGAGQKSLPDPRASVRVIAPCQALRSPLRVNSNLTHHTSNRVCIKLGWLHIVQAHANGPGLQFSVRPLAPPCAGRSNSVCLWPVCVCGVSVAVGPQSIPLVLPKMGCQGAHSCSQRGQKFVVRPATLMRAIGVPHTPQGWPWRRNTSAWSR